MAHGMVKNNETLYQDIANRIFNYIKEEYGLKYKSFSHFYFCCECCELAYEIKGTYDEFGSGDTRHDFTYKDDNEDEECDHRSDQHILTYIMYFDVFVDFKDKTNDESINHFEEYGCELIEKWFFEHRQCSSKNSVKNLLECKKDYEKMVNEGFDERNKK